MSSGKIKTRHQARKNLCKKFLFSFKFRLIRIAPQSGLVFFTSYFSQVGRLKKQEVFSSPNTISLFWSSAVASMAFF